MTEYIDARDLRVGDALPHKNGYVPVTYVTVHDDGTIECPAAAYGAQRGVNRFQPDQKILVRSPRPAAETAPPPVSAARPLGTRGPLVTPGSPEWLRTLSASKISTVMGFNPHDSAFNLWHLMNRTPIGVDGELFQTDPDSDEAKRGHYLEPAVARWFIDQHPEMFASDGGTWTHATEPWATCSPDRLLYDAAALDAVDEHGTPEPPPLALLECKSTTEDWRWDDGIPIHVRVQCLWQMFVTGIDVCHVAWIGSFLEFHDAGTITYDADEVALLIAAGQEFLRTIEAGEVPPLDGSEPTYTAVRKLHPEIGPYDFDTPVELVRFYASTYCEKKAAEDAHRLACSALMQEMGDAKRAMYDGKRIADRRMSQGKAPRPFLFPGVNLPTFTEATPWPDEEDAA